MKEGWEYRRFESCLIKVSKQVQVKSKDYKKEGKFPIVSQEAELISGYWDDEAIVYKHKEPVVIFGDHTKNIKYVDFDFVVGADGTHILRTKNDIEPKFFYYVLKSIKLRELGYARHYKLLKEKYIPVPPLSEQQSIVDYLDSAFAKIVAMKANAENAINEAKALFQASLKEMLEPKEGWEEKKLEDITEVKDGTHDSPKYVTEGIPFVTQKNITINGFDLLNTKKITLEDHKKFYTRSNVEFGDIIIAMIGANRGMSCIVDTREIFSIKNVGLIKKNDNINMRYLLFYLHSPSANTYILDNSNGGAQEFIGLKGLRTFPIPYPPLSEQQSIVTTLDSLKSKVDRLQANFEKISQECDALKQAILRQVFE